MTAKKTKTKAPEAPAASSDSFSISQGQHVEVPASEGPPYGPATIAVGSGSSAFYSERPDVISDPTELAVGESVKVEQTVHLTSAGNSNVVVTRQERPRAVNPARAK